MVKTKRFTVKYRRKQSKQTDYKLRRSLLSSAKPRLVVRKSIKNLTAQLIAYDKRGDKVIAASTTQELKKLGWNYGNNIPTAYLLGLLIGKKAQQKQVKEAILDAGLTSSTKGSKLYAVLKGAIDAGLTIPHSASVLPSQERLNGEHIINYFHKVSSQDSAQFKSSAPEGMLKQLNEIKQK